MKILAIDLGKQKSVGCIYEADGSSVEYRTVRTTPQELHDVILEIGPDRVVIEIGPQAGWVHDLVTAMSVEIDVANPAHEAWRWRKVRSKTDRKDALKLARLSASNQLPTVYMPPREIRDWRESILYRKTLIKRRTAIKNSIRAMLTRLALPMAPCRSGWTRKSLEYLHELASIDDGQLWRASLAEELRQLEIIEQSIKRIERELDRVASNDDGVTLLKTTPGVGSRLSEAIVAVIADPHRFRRGREVSSYIGLAPTQFQSGSMDRQGRISGRGHKVLRSLLVQVAWLGLRNNPWMREVYERTLRGCKSRRKIAIIAVARRLLIRCWAMLRDGTPWRWSASAELRLAA